MPSKAKTRNAPAHQHDKRHENGLAPPGRRVVRQRSNQQLQTNGTVNVRIQGLAPAQQSITTTTGSDHGYDMVRPSEPARSAFSSAPAQFKEHVAFEDVVDRDRTNSDASCEGMAYEIADDAQQDETCCSPTDHNVRRSNHHSRTTDPIATLSGILHYYPLHDAISILILLLFLPATLVLVIQTLFASLTFVPPTAGISLPNIKDLFNTNLGYPALATILILDVLLYLGWLIFPALAQGIILDLAQAVIAVSLSGAAASSSGTTYSVVICSALVFGVHVLRYKAIHLLPLDYLRSVLGKVNLGFDISFAASFSDYHSTQHGWLYTTVHTILGIHIVCQGVTTFFRRWISHQNEKNNHIPTTTRSDTELSPRDGSARVSSSSTSDYAQTPVTPTMDGRPRTSSPGPRDKQRESSTKKRKKQANEVRSKQPLWAAIASTKVTFVKEKEQSSGADDKRESNRLNRSSSTTSMTSKAGKCGKLGVREISDTEVLLSLEHTPGLLEKHTLPMDEELRVGAGIDKSKPFYIRMNGANWSSVRITEDPSITDDFNIEIFGLAPLSSYLCEFFDTTDNTILCSINLVTKTARTAEATPVLPSLVQHQALRPSSPISTLKKSVEQATSNLNDFRNKNKKSRRDQKSAHSDIKREVNSLKAKLENSGGADDKSAKRLQQITTHKTQADGDASQFTRQAEEMGDLPEDERAEFESTKSYWQQASDVRRAASRDADHARADVDRHLREKTNELATAETKRERLAHRHSQRKEDFRTATDKQQEVMSSRQKHMQDRQIKREEHDNNIASLLYHTSAMDNEADALYNKASELYQQGIGMNSWPTPPPGYSSPPTPEVALATTHQTNGFRYDQHSAPYHQSSGQVSSYAPRGRSSSMLSQYSGFTDNGDEPPAFEAKPQITWPLQKHGYNSAIVDDGKEEGSSGSSGNGSTASSSPRPDTRSFASAKMSPIGPPRKKTASPQINGYASPSPPLSSFGNGR